MPESDATTAYAPTPRTRVRRLAERSTYDREAVHAILDEALIAHVGFVADGQPYVLPMAFARAGESIYLHGSRRARLLEQMADGAPVCVTVTLLDGLVLARSAFHHSMNYRSVSILGRPHAIEDEGEKMLALERFTNRVVTGRWAEVRVPTPLELRATLVIEIPLEEVVAKRRSGGPLDDADDLALPVWAGVVPLTMVAGDPLSDPALPEAIADPPADLAQRVRQARRSPSSTS